jgi:hypothetical protein
MAEITAMRNNALPYPMYGLAWTIVYPFLDADGDLVSAATTPDAERSLNGDTFADCTNESTEIATNSGVYYLTLTAAEMTADIVTVIAKSATAGMKTTVATLYPRKLVTFKASATVEGGAAGSITFDAATASALDDAYKGMVIVATIDTLVETRICTGYTASTRVATVSPNWNVTPDSDDTAIIYLTPEMSFMPRVDVRAWLGTAAATPTTAGVPEVDITHIAGSAVSTTSAQLGVNVVNAAGTAWASGSLTSGVFASGAITATAIAADAIGASELAADAVTEIANAVWDTDATGRQTQGTFGQAIGDPAADTNTIFKAVVTDATGATVGVDVAAVLADTGTDGVVVASINANAITATAINADAITAAKIADGAIDAATFAAGAITATVIASNAIDADALAADALAEINAEVVGALNTDTYAEPGQGSPGTTISLAQKIGYLYKAWRNRHTQTSSEYALYADDATTKDQEAVVSDNGTTFERGEISTGA